MWYLIFTPYDLTIQAKKRLSRLTKAKGQIEGIIKMVEDNRYCVDIVTQVLALEGSFSVLSYLVLEAISIAAVQRNWALVIQRKKKFIKEIIKIV